MQMEKGTARCGTGKLALRPDHVDDDVKLAFLAALVAKGTVTAACAAVGISRWEAKKARAADPDFDRLWSEAIEEIADGLEAEAMRRAVHGYELRTTVRRREKKDLKKDEDGGKGSSSGETEGEMEQVAHKYSEGLLVLLLRANRPEKFGGRILVADDNIEAEIAKDLDPPLVERGRVA